MRAAFDRLLRRVQHMVVLGRSTAPVQDAGAIQTVQLSLQPDGAVRDDTRVLSVAGLSSSPPTGTDHLVVFLGGDRSKGVSIATGNQGARFRNLKSGETALHNFGGISILLGVDGVTIDLGGKVMLVKNGTKARFEMPIESTGEITAKVDGAAVRLSQHTHTDPQGGSVGLPSG